MENFIWNLGTLLEASGYYWRTCTLHAAVRLDIFTVIGTGGKTARPFAEKTIARFNLEDRIKFFPGDFTTDIPQDGEPFDAAWLSHVLHGEGPDQAGKVIAHAIKALKPGGRIFIQEFILDDTFDGPLFPALFSLNIFLGTPQGQSYSRQQLSDMLTAFGCTDITRHPFVGPTQSGILSAKTTD